MCMNILVTLDSNYVNPLCKMLTSLGNVHPNDDIALYVAHSSLTDFDFQRINEAVKETSISVIDIKIDKELFKDAPTCKRISKETYYRIFATEYLPKELDRILYIDPDTLIIGPLNEFYNVTMGNAVIAAAKHFDGFVDEWNKFRLNIKHSVQYVNAGIMLINLDNMRKVFDAKKIFDYIRINKPILFLADQDVINVIYDGQIMLYDENVINLDERCFARLVKRMGVDRAFRYIKANTSIVHYNGKYKPWKDGYKGYLDVLYYDDLYGQKSVKQRELRGTINA